MGVNTFLVGRDEEGGWLVEDILRQAGLSLRLGRCAHANLSHDRGLHESVGFLRGYAWHLAREGSPPPPDVHRAAEARAGWRWGATARDVYGPAPDHCPERFPHLLYTHVGASGCFLVPLEFALPRTFEYAPTPPDAELGSRDLAEPWRVYLASAPRLLAELEELDRWLGVPRQALARLAEEERTGPWDLESIDNLVADDDPFCREQEAWLRLHCFATIAVQHDLVVTAE